MASAQWQKDRFAALDRPCGKKVAKVDDAMTLQSLLPSDTM